MNLQKISTVRYTSVGVANTPRGERHHAEDMTHQMRTEPQDDEETSVGGRDDSSQHSSEYLTYEDRSEWLARLQQENAIIRDVRERVRPLARTLGFARAYHVKPVFPSEDLLTGAVPPIKRSPMEITIGLVMQHLYSVGMHKTVATLLQELDKLPPSATPLSSSTSSLSRTTSKVAPTGAPRANQTIQHPNFVISGARTQSASLPSSFSQPAPSQGTASLQNNGKPVLSLPTSLSPSSSPQRPMDVALLSPTPGADTSANAALSTSHFELPPPGTFSIRDVLDPSFYKDQSFFEKTRRESPLLTVLRSAMKRAHEVYELAIADRRSVSEQSESQLEEKLYALGLIEDAEHATDEIDIWVEGPDPVVDLNSPSTYPHHLHMGSPLRTLSGLSSYGNTPPSSARDAGASGGNASSLASSAGSPLHASSTSITSKGLSTPSVDALDHPSSPAHVEPTNFGSDFAGKDSISPVGGHALQAGLSSPAGGSVASSASALTPLAASATAAPPGSPLHSSQPISASTIASTSSAQPLHSASQPLPQKAVSNATSLSLPAQPSKSRAASPGRSSSRDKDHKDKEVNRHQLDEDRQEERKRQQMYNPTTQFAPDDWDDNPIAGRKLIYDLYADVEDNDERPIRAATFNKLVEAATSSKLSDLNFLPTFLLTYKSFSTPRRLLEKLKQRFNVPFSLAAERGLSLEQWKDSFALPIRLRVISFLKRWIQDYPEDFDSQLLLETRKFIVQIVATDASLKLVANSIGTALDRREAQILVALHNEVAGFGHHHQVPTAPGTTSLNSPLSPSSASGSTSNPALPTNAPTRAPAQTSQSLYTSVSVIGGHSFSFQNLLMNHGYSPYASASAIVSMQTQLKASGTQTGKKATVAPGPPPVPKVPKTIFLPTLSLYQIDQEEFARQLTIMDSHVFISIKPSELLNQCWNKPKLKHLAPNVLKMVNMFNQLSHSISTLILQGSKPKDRAKIVEWWIKVAEHCKNLGNFHGLMAVVSGINSGPTVRLRHSRREVSRSLMEQLNSYESIFESDGSFSAYRNTLHSSPTPLIPYLGIHLTDLTFIEEGNKDMQGHLINFAKRRLLYQTISGLQNFQQTGYNLQPVRQIQDIIANLRPAESRDLFKLSLLREPRAKE